ncbi:MAG: flagellin, partial [Thalassolituus sp.]|nr:flagellin [Thalassolituus sp.]
MPQIINTNIASLNAQRNLDKSQSANQQALQRLSSGLRINSAKDDAAGLAISTRFTSQIKGLDVAVRNAGDGIALAQTAEGALGSINESLQRIRELAVQSANATNSDVDRDALQAEVDQLVSEISRTADETDFNGRKLLDGSFSATFQIGANAGQTVDVTIGELTADKLGSSSQAGVSAQGVDAKLGNGDLVINGETIRASIAGDDQLSFADKEKSAISKVAAINASADASGVRATVDENVVVGADMDDVGTAAASTTISL